MWEYFSEKWPIAARRFSVWMGIAERKQDGGGHIFCLYIHPCIRPKCSPTMTTRWRRFFPGHSTGTKSPLLTHTRLSLFVRAWWREVKKDKPKISNRGRPVKPYGVIWTVFLKHFYSKSKDPMFVQYQKKQSCKVAHNIHIWQHQQHASLLLLL